MIEVHHAVAFLRLLAIELRRVETVEHAGQLQGFADKCDAEARDLEAALAPKEEKDAQGR